MKNNVFFFFVLINFALVFCVFSFSVFLLVRAERSTDPQRGFFSFLSFFLVVSRDKINNEVHSLFFSSLFLFLRSFSLSNEEKKIERKTSSLPPSSVASVSRHSSVHRCLSQKKDGGSCNSNDVIQQKFFFCCFSFGFHCEKCFN